MRRQDASQAAKCGGVRSAQSGARGHRTTGERRLGGDRRRVIAEHLNGVSASGALALEGDVTNPGSVYGVLEQAAAAHGGVELIVNAATAYGSGPFGGGPIAKTDLDGFDSWAAAPARAAFSFLSAAAGKRALDGCSSHHGAPSNAPLLISSKSRSTRSGTLRPRSASSTVSRVRRERVQSARSTSRFAICAPSRHAWVLPRGVA